MKNRNVIITGAKEGIGKAFAEQFDNSYNVFLFDINEIDASALKENVYAYKVDVSNRKEFNDAVQDIVAKFGEIEIIANVAGLMNISELVEQDESHIDRMLNVNLKGVINGTQAVIESMIKNKKGTIINVASTAGKYSYDNHAVYCATKYGVRGFSETMRKELASKNIRVMIMSPGYVNTNLLVNGTDESKYLDSYKAWVDTNKMDLQAQDIAVTMKFMVDQPQRVTIREIEMTDSKQVY